MGSALGRHLLVPHPETPPRLITKVVAQMVIKADGGLWLEYHVVPAEQLLRPEPAAPGRADGLWQTTCFEMFVQPAGGESYIEFNFSPSGKWAAYGFSGYRAGMSEWPCEDPAITLSNPGSTFFLALKALPPLPQGPLRIGLSAVLEEQDGTKSYWAVSHPAAKPDFHNAHSFSLELP